MDVGVTLPPVPRRSADSARMAEELGFHTVLFPDSQNLAPEVWGQLMLAARTTRRVQLGPGVTNCVTRDPAVTASAALALQVESDGRAVLGVGRGDSAVQRIGRREERVADFERDLVTLQSYLRGEAVDRDGFPSRLEWLERVRAPKVPVVVVATGPKVIAAAARHADGVCLAVGADPEHVGAMLAHARAAAAAVGREPGAVRWGAFVTAVVHDDVSVARDAVRGVAATFARFSAFAGSPLETLPPPLAAAARWLRERYDMRMHTRADAPHAAGLPDEFVDWFAITGPPEVARERFRALAHLGLHFCWVAPGSPGMPREVAVSSIARLGREVIGGA